MLFFSLLFLRSFVVGLKFIANNCLFFNFLHGILFLSNGANLVEVFHWLCHTLDFNFFLISMIFVFNLNVFFFELNLPLNSYFEV